MSTVSVTTTSLTVPTITSIPSPPQQEALTCQAAVTTLVQQYSQCLDHFDLNYPTTQSADTAASAFVTCICSTSWAAGSPQVLAASLPSCPAPQGLSKGNMAAIAAECSPSATPNQRRMVVQSFGLNTTVAGAVYLPLSGLPPGMTNSAAGKSTSSSVSISMSVLSLASIILLA
ncbi:hypothetical protein O5D80_007532 [Batrachochytrium dendrobatidis]|nr:hypothetical protein O5D80_007532 [Batrachochytrium dendrobatidis]